MTTLLEVAHVRHVNAHHDALAPHRYTNPVEVAQAGTPDGVAIEVADFVLNRTEYRDRSGRDGVGTKILVAGDNFGCGSSREHAPWSISGMGIRAIISTSFADIFHSNCMKNGMLPVTLPREQVLDHPGPLFEEQTLAVGRVVIPSAGHERVGQLARRGEVEGGVVVEGLHAGAPCFALRPGRLGAITRSRSSRS